MNNPDQQKLECIVHDTGPQPEHVVIWLHGLGADGHDFEPIVPQLTCAAGRPVRFIFPHAPIRPVTINGGMAMRAWYDILGMEIDRNQDQAGISASVAAVNQLVDEQLDRGIDCSQLVLAGFSQGGAVALRCGLARSRALAGLIGLSCYLLDADRLEQWMSPAATSVPVFMGHGNQDPVVPVQLGQAGASALEEAGLAVRWLTWPMAHSVNLDEIRAIDQWLMDIWT